MSEPLGRGSAEMEPESEPVSSKPPSGPARRGGARGRAAGSGSYSRFVSIMKIALPLGALALFATVLIYSGVFDSHDRLDISFREISSINNDLRMVSPRIAGLDSTGRPYLITADTATQAQDRPSLVALDNIQADLKMTEDANWLSLAATSGQLDTEHEQLNLAQKVDLYSSWGYEFHGTSAAIDFRKGTLASKEPVEGHGPLGTLRADSMTADNATQTLRFMGRVKVRIYEKPSAKGEK